MADWIVLATALSVIYHRPNDRSADRPTDQSTSEYFLLIPFNHEKLIDTSTKYSSPFMIFEELSAN